MKLLPDAWSDLQGDPIILPKAEGLPREIPRMIARDENTGWQIEASDVRLDVKWNRTLADGEPRAAVLLAQALRYATAYVQELQPEVGRVAAVLRTFAPHPKPGLFLARHFCQERWNSAPLNRPESFEIHSHKKYDCNGFLVNSWVRCKTATRSQLGQQEPGVLVEQDINTLAEQLASRSFSLLDLERFYSGIANEFSRILDLYFPSESHADP